MKLKHIALNIQLEEELVDFYEKVLGFHFVRKYELSAEFANKLFGVDSKTNVFIYAILQYTWNCLSFLKK